MIDSRRRLVLEVAAFLVVVALVVTFASRQRAGSSRQSDTRIMMGTLVSVTVVGADEDLGHRAIGAALEEMERVEALTTRYSTESEVSRINAGSRRASAAADSWGGTAERSGRAVDPEVASIVARALAIAESSDGAFDVTVAPLVDLWGFTGETVAVPDDQEIQDALSRVGFARVQVDTAAAMLTMTGGTEIDLDGIAKGYAVDRAIAVLEELGVPSAVVDAGGDVGLLGEPPDRSGWRVGIKHPRSGGLLGVLTLEGGSVATSGDYQRSIDIEGVRYHHILDPSTGYPARGVVSVSVTADLAMDADALATAIFVLGPERGMRLVEATPGVEAVIVTGDLEAVAEVLVSSGLSERFAASE